MLVEETYSPCRIRSKSQHSSGVNEYSGTGSSSNGSNVDLICADDFAHNNRNNNNMNNRHMNGVRDVSKIFFTSDTWFSIIALSLSRNKSNGRNVEHRLHRRMDLSNTSSDESTNRAQMMQLQQQNGGGGAGWTPRERFAVQRNRSFMPPRSAVPGAGRGAPFAREAPLYSRQIMTCERRDIRNSNERQIEINEGSRKAGASISISGSSPW